MFTVTLYNIRMSEYWCTKDSRIDFILLLNLYDFNHTNLPGCGFKHTTYRLYQFFRSLICHHSPHPITFPLLDQQRFYLHPLQQECVSMDKSISVVFKEFIFYSNFSMVQNIHNVLQNENRKNFTVNRDTLQFHDKHPIYISFYLHTYISRTKVLFT